MQVLLQLLLCSKASSCFCTAAGFWQWSQPLVQVGRASPKYLAIAAWRHLEQAAGQRQGMRVLAKLVLPGPKLGTVSGDRHCAKHGVLIPHVSLTGISVATLQMRTVRRRRFPKVRWHGGRGNAEP